jgi:hypothetical protein
MPMISDVLNDNVSGGDLALGEVQEANGMSFILSSWAYLALADAYLRREGAAALALMDDIEEHITTSLRRFVTETPHGTARPDIIVMASRKMRALIAAGRVAPSGGRNIY